MRVLHHPLTGRPIRVLEADAARWVTAGWVEPTPVVDEPADDPETATPDTADDAASTN